MVSCIILELKEEGEEMALNLRAGFKERQRKRLSESLPTAPPPAKRIRMENPHEVPILDAPLVVMPPSDVAGFSQALIANSSIEKDACPMQDRTSIGQTPGDDHSDKDAPVSSPASNWEKITELLKQGPCFIEPELPSTDMNEFFPLTCRFFVDMHGNPINIAPRLLCGTLESVLSYIKPM